MGVPDAVRFEQRQKINNYHVAYEDSEGKEKKEPVSESADTREKEQVPAAETENIMLPQPHNYVIDIHKQETGGVPACPDR